MARTPTHLETQARLASAIAETEHPESADRAWRDAGAALERALGELTPEERVFLKLRVLHGCTLNEIARAFHFEPPPFRRRFRNLLETLSKLVRAEPPQDA